jgi:hypothetical protein
LAKLSVFFVVAVLMTVVGCSSTLTFKTREQSMRAMVRANDWPEPADSGYIVRDSLQEELLVNRMMRKKPIVKANQGYTALVINYTDSAKIVEIYRRSCGVFCVDLVAGPFYLGSGEIDSCRLPPGRYENRVYSVEGVIEVVNDKEVTVMPVTFNINGEDMHPNAVFGAISTRWASYGGRYRTTRYYSKARSY